MYVIIMPRSPNKEHEVQQLDFYANIYKVVKKDEIKHEITLEIDKKTHTYMDFDMSYILKSL